MTTPLSLEAVVARVKGLPPLPDIVHQLDRAVRDERAGTERIVHLVSSDPALTTAVLRLANSSFYGVSGRAVTLADAVRIHGLQTLSAAVMTAAVMTRFDRSACPGFDFESSWRHALATALCAQLLAKTRGHDEGHAYTAGLLHDIGSLALATWYPAEFSSTLAWSQRHQVLPMEAEHELLGIDHAQVGWKVAEHWRLAPVIGEAIRRHHDEGAAEARDGLLDVLHLADNITHALDMSQAANDMVPPLSTATWERMQMGTDELQLLFRHIEDRMGHLDLGLKA
jgi:putative nucleotidyltransferase with HDIG domain